MEADDTTYAPLSGRERERERERERGLVDFNRLSVCPSYAAAHMLVYEGGEEAELYEFQ